MRISELRWRPYVPVSDRRASAQREMSRLRGEGKSVHPIRISGRTIARSFWGSGWCKHLETFSDYDNRLPRGRTYVRNGSVCHLELEPGKVEAIVAGSSLYEVGIDIEPLKPAAWRALKKTCSGRVGSMLELLQGRLSEHVMAVVTEPRTGLFPRAGEIEYRCDCPDWASMCKHVAAVLYAIGHRLDHQPELLFALRCVDAEELISTDLVLPDAGDGAAGDAIADDELGDIFGIDIEHNVGSDADRLVEVKPGSRRPTRASKAKAAGRRKTGTEAKAKARAGTKPNTTRAARTKTAEARAAKARTAKANATRTSSAGSRAVRSSEEVPRIRPTGKSVARLRKQLGLSVVEFAAELGVTAATVYRWQATAGRLNVRPRTFALLARLHRRSQERSRKR